MKTNVNVKNVGSSRSLR